RAASAVHVVHRRGGAEEPVGLAALKLHLNAVARPQSYAVLQHDILAGHELEANALRDCGENELCLGHSGRHADADTRPAAEGQIGEAVATLAAFRRKALWVKFFRIVPQGAVTMENPGDDGNLSALRNFDAADFVILKHGAI